MLSITRSTNVMTVQTGTVGEPKRDRFRDESAFWFALKKHLNEHCSSLFKAELQDGRMDLIKKEMGKDGHLVGGNGYPYYLRDRKWRFCIHDSQYAIRDVAEAFNETGAVSLSIVHF